MSVFLAIFGLTFSAFRHQNELIRSNQFERHPSEYLMRSLRPAYIAVFLLFAAIQGTASAAHCRSEHVLVLGESTGPYGLGTFEPYRLSWESKVESGEIAWGFSCQEGELPSGRSVPGTHILADRSTVSTVPAPVAFDHDFFFDFPFESACWAPDPRPPRSIELKA